VYVDVRELVNPTLLRQTLATAGVPAIVTFGQFCTGAPAGDVGDLQRVLGKTVHGGEPKLTINPAGIPAGSELSIGIVSVTVTKPGAPAGPILDTDFGLVKEGSQLTCGTPNPGPGEPGGKKGPAAPAGAGTAKTRFPG
jgi:hypothetical protein